MTEGHQGSNTRTVGKNPFMLITSTLTDGPYEQRTVTLGISPLTTLFPLSKIPTGPHSRTKSMICHQTLTWAAPAATVPVCSTFAMSVRHTSTVSANDPLLNLHSQSQWPSQLGLQNTLTASLQRGKLPPTNVLDMTLNNLMVRLQ